MMPLIKAVVTDIDATITDKHRRIDTGAIELIRVIDSKNSPVILASGNAYPVVMYLAKFIGLDNPIVAENGGVVAWEKKGILDVLGDRGKLDKFMKDIFSNYQVSTLPSDAWRMSEYVLKRNMDFEILNKEARMNGFKAEDTNFAYHISQIHVNKLRGVEKALGILDIPLENVLAIGDSHNDVDMIKSCGIGAAVNNAVNEAKQVADYISDENWGGGFQDIIKRYWDQIII